MKLATLNDGSRDGRLVIVSRDLARCVAVPEVARTLQAALDDWDGTAPALDALSAELNAGRLPDADPFDPAAAMAPLPRAYQWADGSAYVNHVELVRRARGATMPPEFWTDPLMYQGGSDSLLGPRDDVVLADEAWGIDFEAEVAVVTGDVPMGAAPADAGARDPPAAAGQRRQPAQPDPCRAGQGLRLPAVQAGQRLLAGGGDARRARRRLARRQGPPAAGVDAQRPGLRPAERRRRHDLRVPAVDRAPRPHARARGRQHRRLGHGLQQGSRRAGPAGGAGRRRLLLHRRAAGGGDDPRRQGGRPRSCASATASASRCWTSRGARSSAPSTRSSASAAAEEPPKLALCGKAASRFAGPAFGCPAAFGLVFASPEGAQRPSPLPRAHAAISPLRRMPIEGAAGVAYDLS